MTVFVFGNYTEDVTFSVDHLPEPGETVLARSRSTGFGGKGANQAVMLARCGIKPVFVTAVGDNPAGRLALQCLNDEGIDLRHSIVTGDATDQSIIYVAPNGANTIVSSHACAAEVTEQRCAAALAEVEDGDLVLLQGNLSRTVTVHCLRESRARGAITVLNTAPIAWNYEELWPLVDLVVANEVEACQLGNSDDPVSGGNALLSAGAATVIVTLGSRGAAVLDVDGIVYCDAPIVQAVDTSGAGDVFCGVITAAVSLGIAVETAAKLAVRAASLSVCRHGTQASFPTKVEMSRLLASA